jgi:hypothetical protein
MLSKIIREKSWAVYFLTVVFGHAETLFHIDLVNLNKANLGDHRSVGLWVVLLVVFVCRALIVIWHTEDEAQQGFTSQQRELYGFQVPYWIERLVFYHGLRGQLILLAGLAMFGFGWAEAAFCSAVGADAILSHFIPSLIQRRSNAGTIPTSIVYALIAFLGVPAIIVHPWVSLVFGGQFALIWLIVGLLGHFRPDPFLSDSENDLI